MNKRLKKIIINPLEIIITLGHRGMLKWMSDVKYLKLAFFCKLHKKLNIENPKTFNEKLQWLKIHDRNPEYTNMVDKFEVKKIVSELIGKEYVIPTIGIFDRFEDINFDNLPEQFVIKCTHDSGSIVICKDKTKFDYKKAKKIINHGMRNNLYLAGREWPYKNVKPRIIIEKYLVDNNTNELRDYKFFTFNGKVKAMYIASNRQENKDNLCFDFFDENFNSLNIINGHKNSIVLPNKPYNFDKMKQLAEIISKNMIHARIDFYEANKQIYFSEITFYHFGGFVSFKPDYWDETFGKLIKLPIERIEK